MKKCQKKNNKNKTLLGKKRQLNFFLILKKWSVESRLRKLKVNGREFCDQVKINDEIKIFFEEVFKCHKGKFFINLSECHRPALSNQRRKRKSVKLNTEGKNFLTLWNKCLKQNPGNDGLSKKFYEEIFWKNLKDPLFKSILSLWNTE